MSIAKATSEALAQLSNTLLRSAEEISSAKTEMDRLLNSIPWDDPVGINFRNSYDEDFRPLTEKLIPAIDDYVTYLENQNLIVLEYDTVTMDSGMISGISAASLGAGAALAGARYVVDLRPISERKGLTDFIKDAQNHRKKDLATKETEEYRKTREEYLKKQAERKKQADEKKRRAEVGKRIIISLNPDGTVKWRGSNENLSRGKEEDKKIYDNAKAAMNRNRIDFNKGVTVAQMRAVVDAVLGSENSEITWSRRPLDSNLEGSHYGKTRLAILNTNLEGNMSACDRMSIFTHEAAHVIQDDLYNYYKGIKKDQRTTDQTDFITAYENYPKNVTYANYNMYRNNRMETDARYYENIVGQACTDYYNEQLKQKHQSTQK